MIRLLLTTALLSAQMSVAEEDQTNDRWYLQGQEALASALAQQPINTAAKNVILFVGDGMGVTTQTAARILEGQLNGQSGEENWLSFERFPYTAMSKTYNTNLQVSDSAGTATAYHTGVKTKAGVIGLSDRADYASCEGSEDAEVISLLRSAEMAGLATGIVSTARITHASPAAAYAHAASREWEGDSELSEEAIQFGCKDIAAQLIDFADGDGIDVALGGGRRFFLTEEQQDPEYPEKTGRRRDGRDLTQEWVASGGAYVWNLEQFASVEEEGRVLGLFEPSHMQYELDRVNDPAGEPSLTDMTAFAINRLEKQGGGYYLFIEAGRIDHAHHANNAHRALYDAVELSKAVAKAVELTNEQETLIVVTADHSHSFALAGYPARGNDIFGWVRGVDEKGHPNDEIVLAEDGQPYTTLNYSTGFVVERDENYGQLDPTDPNFRQGARIPSRSEHHGGEDVVIMARGPKAHAFHGVVEQQFIYHVMLNALQLELQP